MMLVGFRASFPVAPASKADRSWLLLDLALELLLELELLSESAEAA